MTIFLNIVFVTDRPLKIDRIWMPPRSLSIFIFTSYKNIYDFITIKYISS